MSDEKIDIEPLSKAELKELLREVIKELMPERSSAEELIGVPEAAAMLSLAVPTIYEKTSNKSIPHYKHGKKLLFKRSELLAWIETRRVKTIHDIRKDASAYRK